MPDQNSLSSSTVGKDVSARILKKRESDRRCQRIKRERTKSKIAALEERVRNFSDEDATGRVQMLMQHLQDVERERDHLVKKVKTIENVIREADHEEFSQSTITSGYQATSRRPSLSTAASPDHDFLESTNIIYSDGSVMGSLNSELLGDIHTSDISAQYSTATTNPDPSLPDSVQDPNLASLPVPSSVDGYPSALHADQPCECCAASAPTNKKPQFNTWRATNNILSTRFKWPAYYKMLQDHFRADTPVRAVVEGWDAVAVNGMMHPSWHIMKNLDQIIIGRCNPRVRLGILSAIQLLLMTHISPELVPELPSFYAVRPSQTLADSYAIHFFPWPGMRERFVFGQHRYCTNNFWNTFIDGMRLRWPYELRDCYVKNLETGLYSISPLFREHIYDIQCWAMDPDVFEKWPELRADIPTYNSVPMQVSNMLQRPRVVRTPILRRRNSTRAQQVDSTSALVQPIPRSQPSYQVQESVSVPYYQRAMAYSVHGSPDSDLDWPDESLQQSQEGLEYFAAMNNPDIGSMNNPGNPTARF